MNINGGYGSRTTTTTIYQQPYGETSYVTEASGVELDVSYLKTLSGMLKCIAITLDFVCFICVLVGGPAYYAGSGWATFICITGLMISLTLLILYLFHIVDILTQIPWIVCEMIFCFAWTVFFFICGCVLAIAAARFHAATGYGAAAFFSFGAMCTYGFDCYLKFLAWKNDEIATGGFPAGADYPNRNNQTATMTIGQRKVIINDPQY